MHVHRSLTIITRRLTQLHRAHMTVTRTPGAPNTDHFRRSLLGFGAPPVGVEAPCARVDNLQDDVIPDQTTDPAESIHGPTDSEPVTQKCVGHLEKQLRSRGIEASAAAGWRMWTLARRTLKKVLCAAKSDEP